MDNNKIKFEKVTTFPMAMFDLKNYDGAKAFALIVFILGSLYFMNGIFSLTFLENSWLLPDFVIKSFYFTYHVIVFTIVYCLTWLIFDKKGIEGYALAVFSCIFGFTYIVSPVDLIPEAIIPIIGQFDDIVIGYGSTFVGIRSYLNNKNKNVTNKNIINLIKDGKNDDAIKLYLKENGYIVTDNS